MQRNAPAVSHTLVSLATVSLNLSVTLVSQLVSLVRPRLGKKSKKMVSPGACGVLARPGPSVQLWARVPAATMPRK